MDELTRCTNFSYFTCNKTNGIN